MGRANSFQMKQVLSGPGPGQATGISQGELSGLPSLAKPLAGLGGALVEGGGCIEG